MDTVFADNETIVVTLKRSRLVSGDATGETRTMQAEPVIPQAKRFGLVDLWKIHSGKRHANVYPRRIYGM